MALDITSYAMGKKKGGGGTPPTYQDKEITITTNGDTTITADSGYDALRKVDITTNVPAGADLDDYFNDTIPSSAIISSQNPGWTYLIKKIPEPITIEKNSMYYMFYGATYIPKFITTTNITNWSGAFQSSKAETKFDMSNYQFYNYITTFDSMFANSSFTEINLSSLGTNRTSANLNSMFWFASKLKKINLQNFTITAGNNSCSGMFNGCSQLEELDMSSFDFSKLTISANMFNNVPDNCLIYVKDQTQKDWFTTNFSRFTNVQIKGA